MRSGSKQFSGFLSRREEGRGISSAISKSNMRNRIATMKKRKENGRREEVIGSNPHS